MVTVRLFALLALLVASALTMSCTAENSSNDVVDLPESAQSSREPAGGSIPTSTTPGVALSPEELAAVASAPSISLAEAKIDSIRLRVKPGNFFRYRLTQRTSSTQDSVVAVTTGTHVYHIRVKSIRPDGSVEVGMQFDSITLGLEARKVDTREVVSQSSYNSADTANFRDVRNINYSALIGEEVTVIISPQGEAIQVSDVGTIVNKIVAAFPDKNRMTPQVKSYITEQVKTSMFTTFIAQQFVPYPQGTVSAKGTWSRKQETPIGTLFTVMTDTDYKITGVKKVDNHLIATVEASVTGSMKLGAPPPDATSKLVLNRSKITGSSEAVLDVTTGMTIRKVNRLSQDVTATTSAIDMPDSRVLSQKQDIIFTVELLP